MSYATTELIASGPLIKVRHLVMTASKRMIRLTTASTALAFLCAFFPLANAGVTLKNTPDGTAYVRIDGVITKGGRKAR